ncbi:hypothetical protein ACFLT9_04420 [Acidobacteriota bacterium]
MNIRTKTALILTMVLCVSFFLMAQKTTDLAGTWAGDATIGGMGDPNLLTLVLELKDGKLSGKMNDEFETIIEAEISEIKLADGVFSFSVTARGPGGEDAVLNFKMKVTGNSMEGTFEIPDMGLSGTWEATKK